MNPYVPALLVSAGFVFVVRGWAMFRDRGPVARLQSPPDDQPHAAPRRAVPGRIVTYLSDRLAPRVTRLLSEGQRDAIRRRLDAAGRPGGMTIESYAGRKAAFTVVFGVSALLFLAQGKTLPGVLFAAAGFFWIDIWLGRAARARQAQLDRDLPDFLDILAVTVNAGVGFRPALTRVSEALGGPVAEEIVTALRQMDLGASRREAFQALRRRNQSEQLNQFVTALLQAEELGVPLADALVGLATDMRRTAYQRARTSAARAAPRVSLIVSTIVVPGAVILIIAALFIGSDLNVGGLFG